MLNGIGLDRAHPASERIIHLVALEREEHVIRQEQRLAVPGSAFPAQGLQQRSHLTPIGSSIRRTTQEQDFRGRRAFQGNQTGQH